MIKQFIALVTARNKEYYRDRGSMGWALGFPLIVLLGFGYGYTGKQDPLIKVSVFGGGTAQVVEKLSGIPGMKTISCDAEDECLKKLSRYEYDLFLKVEKSDSGPGKGGGLSAEDRMVYSFHSDSDKGRLGEKLLLDLVAEQNARPNSGRCLAQRAEIRGKKVRYADWVLPGLLGMNLMFGSMFGVGYVIVRYRKNGVLKRLSATPLSAAQFLFAQVASRILLLLINAAILIAGSYLLIGFRVEGSLLDLALFLAISGLAMISLGLIIAARISNEEVAEGVLNVMTWPMIFLSGVWFSLEGASHWVKLGSKAIPLSHIVNGLRSIMIEGNSITTLIPDMAVLLGMSVVFIFLGAKVFRWR